MNLLMRLFIVVVHAFFRPKVGFFDQSSVRFRVLPTDLDLNFHMTNSRYLSVMDLGRTDHLIRTGHVSFFLKKKWQAVLGSSNIRFRRALNIFQVYDLKTKVIGLDDRWIYIEQRFESKGELVAYAVVRAVFINKRGRVQIHQVLKDLHLENPFTELKKPLEHWNQMDESLRDHYTS